MTLTPQSTKPLKLNQFIRVTSSAKVNDALGVPHSQAFVSTLIPSNTAFAAATAVRQSSPTVAGRHTRALNSIVTIASHEDALHHSARTEAADQAIASLLGSATRRRFVPSHRLDLDTDLLADIAAGV